MQHTHGFTDNHNHIHEQQTNHHDDDSPFDEFCEEVITSLGGTLVDVELSPNDIKLCFKKAKRTMRQKGHVGYNKKFIKLTTTRAERTYKLSDDVYFVVSLLTPNSGMSFTVQDPFSHQAYESIMGRRSLMGTGGCSAGRMDILTYELALGYMETLAKYAQNNKEFHFNELTKELTIWGEPLGGVYLAEQYMELDDSDLYNNDWVVRWTIAEAKQILGTAYRKFSSVAGPTGEVSLNGDSLIQEAQQEKEQLLLDIENFVDGSIDYSPIIFG